MIGVETDRFDHEVEFVGTVDFARDAISHVGLHALSFAEVIESVNALRVAILQQEQSGLETACGIPTGTVLSFCGIRTGDLLDRFEN